MDQHSLERTILAMECAEALGIKPISPVLYDYAVRQSDLPELRSDGMPTGYSETSLLSMGVAYSYGTTFSFIDVSGHTCILPYNDVVKNELEKCGYVVCEYGKGSPNFGYSIGMDGQVDENAEGYYEALKREEELRAKVTLPEELAQKVMKHEVLSTIPKYHDYAYDVFANNLYRGHQYSRDEVEGVVETLGYESPVSRKIMALAGYACTSLSNITTTAEDLKTYIIHASNHPILNDSVYYGQGGMYDQLNGAVKK